MPTLQTLQQQDHLMELHDAIQLTLEQLAFTCRPFGVQLTPLATA